MSVNFETSAQTNFQSCQNKIQKLREMLDLNQKAQTQLLKMQKDIEVRRRELEETGVLPQPHLDTVNPIFDSTSALNEQRKVPLLLLDQQLLKKNSAYEYNFMRNIIQEQKEPKTKKNKTQKEQCLDSESKPSDPKKIDFISEGEKHSVSGIEYYKEWRKKNIKNNENKLEYQIDEKRLAEKRKIYGDNWEKICYFFNGFTFEDLYYYFQKKKLNKAEEGKWTRRQSLMLIALAEYYRQGKWAMISKKLKVKSEFQIRERFCNILNPALKQNKWTEEDEELLLKTAPLKGYKWSKLAKEVPQFTNKTDNSLRRKFRNLMIKKNDGQICDAINNNQKLKKSILKFKKGYYNRSKKQASGSGNEGNKMQEEQN